MAALGHDRGARVMSPRRPGGNLIGKPPLPKLSSQRTLRWRELDSNFRFRARFNCWPPGEADDGCRSQLLGFYKG